MIKNRLIIATCLFITTAVVISSLHSVQVAAAAQTEKLVEESAVKIHADLHSHVDKAGKVISDAPQTDARSLRLRDVKRSLKNSPLAHLFGSWRDYLTLYL